MPRIAIPEVGIEDLPEDMQEAARSGALVNVFRIMILTGYYFLIARLSTVFEVMQDPQKGDSVLRAGVALDPGN
jgi:hypothetical protein